MWPSEARCHFSRVSAGASANTFADTPPAYVDCGLDGDDTRCSTIDYKASTRKYVQDELGLHIVANFGDQYSDLIGGSSDRAVKLPNPTYYLP